MFSVAYALFLANFTFGILVRTGVVPPVRFRRIHHLLYFAVIISLAAAVVTEVLLYNRFAIAPAGVFCLLLAMPLFRGHSRAHTLYAVLCFVAYTTVVVV